MNELELRRRFEDDKEIYLAWGNYVKNYVEKKLGEMEYNPSTFLQISTEPRVKDTDSFIEKALYRSKNYKTPYDEITDKVGVRFVVLTEKELRILQNIIDMWKSSEEITADLDNDYTDKIHRDPNIFWYKSIHYIVRNTEELRQELLSKEIIIPKNTPCEIQLRTLLQHAWAEVSHRELYKKDEAIEPEIKRRMALSMAFVEATENEFYEIHHSLDKIEVDFEDYVSKLKKEIEWSESKTYLPKTNKCIYSSYLEIIKSNDITPQTLREFITSEDYSFLKSNILNGKFSEPLYFQPMIVLMYYLIANDMDNLYELWPLKKNYLDYLYNDLGKSANTD